MSTINTTAARAVADPAEGQLLACVEIEVEPDRVFRALTSGEITAWWVRPGVFDTREWSGDVSCSATSNEAASRKSWQEAPWMWYPRVKPPMEKTSIPMLIPEPVSLWIPNSRLNMLQPQEILSSGFGNEKQDRRDAFP